jgi:hypothetical protein
MSFACLHEPKLVSEDLKGWSVFFVTWKSFYFMWSSSQMVTLHRIKSSKSFSKWFLQMVLIIGMFKGFHCLLSMSHTGWSGLTRGPWCFASIMRFSALGLWTDNLFVFCFPPHIGAGHAPEISEVAQKSHCSKLFQL